ncbi:hypothetical protein HDV05_005251 [Chytridiales sp. JEL 0842]|nr:hypothetical protein HDV05_005251 [Chytridiales sp. JEL 0842]
MHFTSIFAAALSILSIVCAATTPNATATPNPAGDPPKLKDIIIGDITYSGLGCPPETLHLLFNVNSTDFSLFFDEYVLIHGYKNVPLTESRKACNVGIGITVPQGWQYSLRSIEYQGFWNFDEGVVGTSNAYYYFRRSLQSEKATTFRPTSTTNMADFVVKDSFPLDIWSPCGGKSTLYVGTDINLSGSGQGLMTLDSIFNRFTQVYAINWRRC